MSEKPLEGVDEFFARSEAQGMLLTFLVAWIADRDPSFPVGVMQMLDDAPPYLQQIQAPADPARSLRIRERAQALLRQNMNEFQLARK